MDITYIGEHLIWGQLGRFSVLLSFCGALLAAVAYWFAHRNPDSAASWQKIARTGFGIHTSGVIAVIGILFVMLFNHYFEYRYVWEHSNRAMPMQYILSCFWEGQEGSFLLWAFWNMVLGHILIKSAREWEHTTMAVVSLVQVFLSSMLLGIYVGEFRIGSDPFILLREHPDFMNLPFVQQAGYLNSLDGRGLNPLLQNYWMTIHPPTLFLGFASVLFPFAYAMAGIWKKEYFSWIKPALSWMFFAICILGTGILMGGAWAYEALSFGGFWAWDPVENASLVPWITLVAGGHVMMLTQVRKQSPLTALFLVFISFILILYSTFLTRSGILGETSVHAFTDLGMSGQLLIYLLVFLWLPAILVIRQEKAGWIYFGISMLVLFGGLTGGIFKLIAAAFLLGSLIYAFRRIAKIHSHAQEEEKLSSREFWMFIGSLVLLVSAFQITFSTSTPVINKFISGEISGFFSWLNGKFPAEIFQKLADAKMGLQEDPIKHYNSWQIPFAIITALLIGVGQFLRYRDTPLPALIGKLLRSLIASVVLTVCTAWLVKLDQALLLMLLFASFFAVLANIDFLIRNAKGGLRKAGPSIAHAGFGLILAGSLISAGKKEFISRNMSQYDLGEELPNEENILLFKHDTVRMGEYLVTYRGDSTAGINIYYHVDYLKPQASGKHEKLFTLSPLIQTNPRMGNVTEPDTRHYFHRDIFTHVTSVSKDEEEEAWNEPVLFQMKVGDTASGEGFTMKLLEIVKDPVSESAGQVPGTIRAGAKIAVEHHGHTEIVVPRFMVQQNRISPIDTTLEHAGLHFSFEKIDPVNEIFSISVKSRKKSLQEFIVMKAIIFPGINILWMGCILMAIGTGMAVLQRIRTQSRKDVVS
jgi:cytochrome c-type biogenesis protein CcmF